MIPPISGKFGTMGGAFWFWSCNSATVPTIFAIEYFMLVLGCIDYRGWLLTECNQHQSTTSWRAPSRPILQQHLSVALASLEETWGNAEEIALPVQESGQTQCSETTALGATCFPDCISWCEEWLQRKSGNMWHHYAKLCEIGTDWKHLQISSGHGVLFPCHQGLAQQQLPHAKLHGPSRLSGAASCIPIIKDLLRCNLVEQWLSNPTDTLLFQYVTMIMSHTIIHLAKQNVIWGDPTEFLSRTIMKNNCNYANPNQISKDISWYIHIYIYYIYTSIISFAALWGMLEPSGRGLTAIR